MKYLVFDSKFTNYENLSKIDDDNVKFITIRRRGSNMVERLNSLPKNRWKTMHIERAGNKKATVKVIDEVIFLKGYNKDIRQICITGHGKIKPAIIITNDFQVSKEQIVRKYARRWIVEKSISEQISFFHLNLVSSSMVIKVDFDLTMSIVTHNLFRLFASDTDRYAHNSDQTIYDKFLENSGISVSKKIKYQQLKKKNATTDFKADKTYANQKYEWLNNLNRV